MSAAESMAGHHAETSLSPPATDPPPAPTSPPVGPRAALCIVAIVATADIAIYRGEGFSGYALLFAVTPFFLLFGVAPRRTDPALWIAGPLLLLIVARLIWCGSWLTVAVGFSLLAAIPMALVGLRPYVLETIVFVAQTIPAGAHALRRRGAMSTARPTLDRGPLPLWSAIMIPLGVILTFSAIFMLANPDLLSWFSAELSRVIERAQNWLLEFGPSQMEVLFWAVTAWIALGLLRPLTLTPATDSEQPAVAESMSPEQAPLYVAYRNTLASVVILFAVYLAFEFATLWFREFPEGFHYSGYAHQGAAWLTLALALATGLLSLIFQGRTLRDRRLVVLRRFAGLWALENLLLGIAVYNRLFIYIGFNGMTRMRVVGLLGITAVVVGFILVLIKIRRNQNFTWLVRQHLWTLAAAFYIYAVLPVDVIAMKYNVRRITAGDPAPSVQISEHPISAEGYLMLPPLLKSDNTLIREGIRAMLAARLEQFENRPETHHWTAYQIAEQRLESQLRSISDKLTVYQNARQRADARAAFAEYAYQWW